MISIQQQVGIVLVTILAFGMISFALVGDFIFLQRATYLEKQAENDGVVAACERLLFYFPDSPYASEARKIIERVSRPPAVSPTGIAHSLADPSPPPSPNPGMF